MIPAESSSLDDESPSPGITVDVGDDATSGVMSDVGRARRSGGNGKGVEAVPQSALSCATPKDGLHSKSLAGMMPATSLHKNNGVS